MIVLNRRVEKELAEILSENFFELLFAPGYGDGALEVLQTRSNIRIIEDAEQRKGNVGERDMRRVIGGLMLQDRDADLEERSTMNVVTKRQPTEEQWGDLLFAWKACKHVRSNAIVLAKELRHDRDRGRSDEPGRIGAPGGGESPPGRSTDQRVGAGLRRLLPVRRRSRDGERGGRGRDHPAGWLEARQRGDRRLQQGGRRDGLHRPPALQALVRVALASLALVRRAVLLLMTAFKQEEAWQRFLENAAFILADPRFEPEERDRKLAVARDAQALIEMSGSADRLRPGLDELCSSLCDPLWPYHLILPAHWKRIKRWASSDEPTFRQALSAFATGEEDSFERFADFASAAAKAQERRAIMRDHDLTAVLLVFGSLFNFALDPHSLPMIVRPVPFERAEQKLGYQSPDGESVAGLYEHHVRFARELEAELRQAGVPVRDALDVHGLIFLSSERPWLWTQELPDRRSRVRRPTSKRPAGTPALALCASLGYEAPYLLEWIEFHRLVGVERFFLYNNGDRQVQRELLSPYVERGIVVLHDFPHFPPNIAAVRDCIRRHRQDARWIAFSDVDEFVYSPTGRPLPEVLVDYEGWPGVGASITMFGPSGHRRKPTGLVVESYVHRLGLFRINPVQLIVDPTRVLPGRGTSHHLFYDEGYAIDENYYPISGGWPTFTSIARLRTNHYFTRSEEEFRAKISRPMPHDAAPRPPFDFEKILRHERVCGREDTAIQRYLPALREALRKLEVEGVSGR